MYGGGLGDGRIGARACGLGVGGFFYGVMCLRMWAGDGTSLWRVWLGAWAAINPAKRGQMPCGICLIKG